MIKILITAIVVAVLTTFVVVVIQREETAIEVDIPVVTERATQAESKENEALPQNNLKEIAPRVSADNTLDLSGRGLTKTPAYVFDRTNLQALNLSDNNLEGALQAEVRHLQNLRVLNLSNNQFTGLPAEIGQLQNLEILNLSNNNLTGLPYELGNLSNLKELNLKGNDYSSLDLNIIKENLPASTVVYVD